MFSLRLNNARAGINQPATRPAPYHRHWLAAHIAANLLAKALPLLPSIGESHDQSRLCLPPPVPSPRPCPKGHRVYSDRVSRESSGRAGGAGAARAGPVRRGRAGPEGPVRAEGAPGFLWPLHPARCARTLPRGGGRGRSTPWRAVTQCLTSQQLCYK